MKKKYIAILLAISVVLGGCCNNAQSNEAKESMMGVIEKGLCYIVLFDKDTGVTYITYGNGGVTPMYNADGSLKIVEQE